MSNLASAVFPDPTRTAFPSVNTITLANTVMPGKWTLLDAPKEFGWQVQQAFGLSGAFLLPIGDPIVAPKFRAEFWASQDYATFRQLRKSLLKKPVFAVGGTLTSKALSIEHPELKDLGVTSVVVKRVHPTKDEGAGLWTTEVEFYHWKPPQVVLPKPTSTIPDTNNPPPSAQDAQDLEIQQATATLKGLMGR